MSETRELESRQQMLISRKEVLFSRLQLLYDLSAQLTADPTQIGVFNVRLEELKETRTTFSDTLEEIYCISITLDPKSSSKAVQSMQQQLKAFDELYFKLLAFAADLKVTQGAGLSTGTSQNSHIDLRLPKLELKVFNGDLLEWPVFYDNFCSLIHNNASLNVISKFHYLISVLSGPPLGIVKSLPLTENNYQIVWDCLVDKYQNKRILGTSLLDKMCAFHPLHVESADNLHKFLETFYESVTALKAMQIVDLADFILLYMALRSLPTETRKQFEMQQIKNEIPTFTQLVAFIRDEVRVLEVSHSQENNTTFRLPIKPISKKPDPSKGDTRVSHKLMSSMFPRKSFVNTTKTKNLASCPCCKQFHHIYGCSNFQALSPIQRKELATKLKLCFNCLRDSHLVPQCKSKQNCGMCGYRHHTLLHFGKPQDALAKLIPQECGPNQHDLTDNKNRDNEGSLSAPKCSNEVKSVHVLSGSTQSSVATVLLGTAVALMQDSSGIFRPIRILIDSASQLSFITNACVQRFGLTRTKCNIPVVGLGQTEVQISKGKVNCLIKSRMNAEPHLSTNAVILPKITCPTPATQVPTNICMEFKHLNLQLADDQCDLPGNIDFLLGADLFPVVYNGKRIQLSSGSLYALGSIFGWVLTGQYVTADEPNHVKSLLVSVDEHSLDAVVKRFWELEEPPRKRLVTPDEEQCEALFNTRHYREASGRYVVPLPFKIPEVSLGDSYHQAATRFSHLERRLGRQPDLKHQYTNFIREYEDLGHMELVSGNTDKSNSYFIPHHAVMKESSSSTKLRVVFDASMSTTNNQSLNDLLYVGPNLLRDITEVICLFRCPQIVFTADICKMYRQILILPEHRRYQHILWRDTPSDMLSEYELKTVTYGVSSAPYLALRTLQQLIADEGANFPAAARAINQGMYVDDLLIGSNSLEEAYLLQEQVIKLLALGGFQLRKWSSNNVEVLNQVPRDHRETPLILDPDGGSIVKILGIQWNASRDWFSYQVTPREIVFTKRGILSYISRLFDPLGWVTPVTFVAKSLLQQLWCLRLGWDEPLPTSIQETWDDYLNHLPKLTDIRLCRLILPANYISCELIGFCDASQRGYAAVVYLRVVSKDNHVSVHLLMAKSRVAPLKTISVPRLELNGALLLATLIKWLHKLYNNVIKIDGILAFTDSTVVLSWLRTSPHVLRTFVANRVTTILECLPASSWFHVTTAENPADCASRGLLPQHLQEFTLWWNGPSWLTRSTSEWPDTEVASVSADLLPEIKVAVCTSLPVNKIFSESDMLSRFSSLCQLQRITAWCLRFISNTRSKSLAKPHIVSAPSPLTPPELRSALYLWVKQVQQASFADDIVLISKGLPCSTALQRLQPFIDAAGFLRVGGRLRHASIAESSKHPLILPKISHLTNLLINHYHKNYLHIGPRALQSIMCRNYWIISARSAIKQLLYKCVTCLKLRAVCQQPVMGDLPVSRVRQGRPFLEVGIDFGGPFLVKASKRRNAKIDKVYMCLFVCMSTKAVHLEVVSDLSSAAFLAAFDRFVSRRGRCTDVFSDNGTNFKGADGFLTGVFKAFNSSPCKEEIYQGLSAHGITWHFNPPSAPHFGGIWEAGIRSAKYHLKRVVGDQVLTFEELVTIFNKIEAILNSRPLCALSNEPDDFDALTPGHFLIGAPLVALPEVDIADVATNRLSRWQLLQQATQRFWSRWSKDYLNTLQLRVKWTKKQANLIIGDLVIIKEDGVPPLHWRMGRIEKIHPGEDKIVRVVTVKTAKGSLLRPVVKLCPLLKG